MPPPSGSHRILSIWLRALAPIVLLTGCVAGLGTAIAGNGRGGDALTGFCFFAAVAMYLGGIAMKRHVRLADQPEQNITLQRLLVHPSFSIYVLDNARAKIVGEELRAALARVKDGLLVNRDIDQPESFEL